MIHFVHAEKASNTRVDGLGKLWNIQFFQVLKMSLNGMTLDRPGNLEGSFLNLVF